MLEVFGVAEMDLSQRQAKLSPAPGHARDQEKHSFQSDVSIKVRGCFDSMHIAELKLDDCCFILEIKHRLQTYANVPIRYQTLLRAGDVVPLDDLHTLHAAGFRSEEVLLLVKQRPKQAMQELMNLPIDLSPSQTEAEVKFLLSNMAFVSPEMSWQLQMRFESAVRSGNLSLARPLLEHARIDPNVGWNCMCCAMGCCGAPYMTLLEVCAQQGHKEVCLWLLGSGRLTMVNCTSVDKAFAEFDSMRAFGRYLSGNKLYHIIQEEGWDSTYQLCHAYVERVNHAWFERKADMNLDDAYLSEEEDEEEAKKIEDALHVLHQSRREKRYQAGHEHSRPLHQQKLQERWHRQRKRAELKSCRERRSWRMRRLRDRNHKAWSQGVSFLCASPV